MDYMMTKDTSHAGMYRLSARESSNKPLCRVSGAGSFIRPSPKLVFGTDFLSALRNKYIGEGEQLEKADSTTYSRRNLAEIQVEVPNLSSVQKKTARLERLRHVGLGGWRHTATLEGSEDDGRGLVAQAYSREEDEGIIRATCPCVQWLDISHSLLSTWTQVARITAELPQLETLILDDNRFAPLQGVDDVSEKAFVRLRDLHVNNIRMSWKELCLAVSKMPLIEELQIGHNGLSCTETQLQAPLLHTLNVDGNHLQDWCTLVKALVGCTR